MDLLEYQSKNILARAGIDVPAGMVLDERMDVTTVFSCLGLSEGALKAQVHAGARGIGGGVRYVHSVEEAEAVAKDLLGSRLITPQTGLEGIVVRELLFEEIVRVEVEYYLAVAVDRSISGPVLIFSSEGGKGIEDVARVSPERIFKTPIDPLNGLSLSESKRIAASFGIDGDKVESLSGTMKRLYELFVSKDALLAEINPLAYTGRGFVALDAKITIDDNALFRHPEFSSMRDHEEDVWEREAREAGISYLRLDGNVGCMANGAGLAMATMDVIRSAGKKPANFLDIGGGAHQPQVSAALRILFSNPKVRVVFINIFGGMVHCDIIASGIIEAARNLRPKIPIIVRLEGTDAAEGRRTISESGLPVTMVADMKEAAEIISRLSAAGQ